MRHASGSKTLVHSPMSDEQFVVPIGRGDAAAAGVAINFPNQDDLLQDIKQLLSEGHGFSVATLNLDHVVKLRSSEAFRAAYANHSHIVADGNPIVWLSRLAGRPVSLVPGSELIAPLASLAAQVGAPIGLFGASEVALAEAAALLEQDYPGLEVVDRIAPPFGFDPKGSQADTYIAQMDRSRARIWFLALGAPKQEVFAARASARLPAVGFVSIGAGLDFIAGSQTRAPGVVRAFALEWVWRMMSNPRRLGPRYLRCIGVLPGLSIRVLSGRLGNAGKGAL